MLTISGAINLSSLTEIYKKKTLSKIYSGSKDQDFKNLDLSLINASRTPRPLISLEKIIATTSVLEKAIVIVAFTDPDLKALHQALGSIWPIFLLETIVTNYLKEMTKS